MSKTSQEADMDIQEFRRLNPQDGHQVWPVLIPMDNFEDFKGPPSDQGGFYWMVWAQDFSEDAEGLLGVKKAKKFMQEENNDVLFTSPYFIRSTEATQNLLVPRLEAMKEVDRFGISRHPLGFALHVHEGMWTQHGAHLRQCQPKSLLWGSAEALWGHVIRESKGYSNDVKTWAQDFQSKARQLKEKETAFIERCVERIESRKVDRAPYVWMSFEFEAVLDEPDQATSSKNSSSPWRFQGVPMVVPFDDIRDATAFQREAQQLLDARDTLFREEVSSGLNIFKSAKNKSKDQKKTKSINEAILRLQILSRFEESWIVDGRNWGPSMENLKVFQGGFIENRKGERVEPLTAQGFVSLIEQEAREQPDEIPKFWDIMTTRMRADRLAQSRGSDDVQHPENQAIAKHKQRF